MNQEKICSYLFYCFVFHSSQEKYSSIIFPHKSIKLGNFYLFLKCSVICLTFLSLIRSYYCSMVVSHFSKTPSQTTTFCELGLGILGIRVTLTGMLGFYGRSKVLEIWGSALYKMLFWWLYCSCHASATTEKVIIDQFAILWRFIA